MLRVYIFNCILAVLFCSVDTHAQTMNLGDSLRLVFKQKKSPSFKFETRNSFITGSSAKIYGIKAGVAFGKRFNAGIGYNFIGTELTQSLELTKNQLVQADIVMNYIAPFVEYSFYRKGPWELSVPIQIGAGKSFLRYTLDEQQHVVNRNTVVLYEPGMTFEYKILNVIGVGAGFGYRIMLKNNRDIEQQFTSPVYALRLRLIFDELYGRYKKHIAPTNTTGEENNE
jgi:hypothetical protein